MPHLSPQTLTEAEQRALLRASAAHPRDHLVFSLALGTGLRLAEIVGLDVGDVFFPDGAPRGRVRLRAEIAKRHRAGDVFLPDALVPKLRRFWNYKVARGEPLAPAAPLFCSQSGRRLSKRRVQILFRAWQVIAGFDRLVILKSLLPDLAAEPGFIDEFLDEARVAAMLNHPNIVSIYEVGEWTGTYYIAMEYIHGDNLSRLLQAVAKNPVEMPLLASSS